MLRKLELTHFLTFASPVFLVASSFLYAAEDEAGTCDSLQGNICLTGNVEVNLTPNINEVTGEIVNFAAGGFVSELDFGVGLSPILSIGLRDAYTVSGTSTDWTNIAAWDNPGLALNTVGAIVKPIIDAKHGNFIGAFKGVVDLPNALDNAGPTEFNYSIDLGPSLSVKSTTSSDAIPLLDAHLTLDAGFRYDVTLDSGSIVNMNQAAVLQTLTVENSAFLSGNAGMLVKDKMSNSGTINDLQGVATIFENENTVTIKNSFVTNENFINTGTVTIDSGSMVLETDASVDNSGEVIIKENGVLQADGFLNGTGLIKLKTGGSLSSKNSTFSTNNLISEGGRLSGPGIFANDAKVVVQGEPATVMSAGSKFYNNKIVSQKNDANLSFDSHNNRGAIANSAVTNNAEATYDLSGDGDLIGGTHSKTTSRWRPFGGSIVTTTYEPGRGTGEFNNKGTFIKSRGEGESVVESGIAFNNTGTVNVKSGTLSIYQANGDEGRYKVDENSSLQLLGGSRTNHQYDFDDNTSSIIKGTDSSGVFNLGRDSHVEYGANTGSVSTFNGEGTVVLNGTHTQPGASAVLDGNVSNIVLAGSIEASSGSSLTFDFDNAVQFMGGTIKGDGKVINRSAMDWHYGGIISDNFQNTSDELTLIGDSRKYIGAFGTLSNEGRIIQTGESDLAFFSYYNPRTNSSYALSSSSLIHNKSNGIYDISGDGDLVQGDMARRDFYSQKYLFTSEGNGTGTFKNEGLFVKSAGTGESVVETGITFNNIGKVEVKSGTLNFDGDFYNTGDVDIDSDAKLKLSKDSSNVGLITIDAGASLFGKLIDQHGGEIKVNGLLSLENLNVYGGSVSGSGLIDSNLTLFGGAIAPGNSPGQLELTGDLVLETGSILDFEVAGAAPGMFDKLLIGGDLFINGMVTFNISFLNGFTAKKGDLFDFLSLSGSTIGDFSLLQFNVISEYLFDYNIQYSNGSFNFNVLSDVFPSSNEVSSVNTPSSVALILSSIFFLSMSEKRKKRKQRHQN